MAGSWIYYSFSGLVEWLAKQNWTDTEMGFVFVKRMEEFVEFDSCKYQWTGLTKSDGRYEWAKTGE